MPSGVPAEGVPTKILRDAYDRSPKTSTDIAKELGWSITLRRPGRPDRESPDTSRVRRYLGITPYTSGDKKIRTRQYVRPSTALMLASVLDIDPRDIGL